MDEITIGDKLYVSSKRAAQITGYAKDYIGQLCREGRVEARLVGRNWYVLDSALREHRFGKVSEEPVTKIEEKAPESPISTWKRPEYVPEIPVFVPNLAPKPEKSEDLQIGTPAIADMQTAWKEWFQEKNEVVVENKEEESVSQEVQITTKHAEPELETYVPEPEAEEVALNRIEDAQDIDSEQEVEIHREYRTTASLTQIQPNQAIEPPFQPQTPEFNETKSSRGTVAAQIALILLSLSAIAVATVGTGNAERLFGGTSIDLGFQKSIIDYLGGKSEYKSSL